MVDLWERHLVYEFEEHDADKTVSTMVEDAYVNHVPTMTGGHTREGLRTFYGNHFVNQVPPDWKITPISRTVGEDLIVDEMINEFSHTNAMDWIFPGIAPTGKKVKLAVVVIAHFRDGKLAHEHIYWDQASALVQIGRLDPDSLPVVGAEGAERVLASQRPGMAG
jgi:carboxymethylenebutenolidase